MRTGRRQRIGVVGVGDVDVVDALMARRGFDCGDLDVGACAGSQPHAELEPAGVHPLLECGEFRRGGCR